MILIIAGLKLIDVARRGPGKSQRLDMIKKNTNKSFHVSSKHLRTQSVNVIHYNDVIMGAIASQITSLMIVYSTVYSDADQRKHISFESLAFVRGIHRWPVNSPHKGPVTRKMFPFDDVSMIPQVGWQTWKVVRLFKNWQKNFLTWQSTLVVISSYLWVSFTYRGRDKMADIFRRHFQLQFLEWKCMNFD